MDYYQCSFEALHGEVQRRTLSTHGSHDLLSERLQSDDDERGSDATTVITENVSDITPREVSIIKTGGFGQRFPAAWLKNRGARRLADKFVT